MQCELLNEKKYFTEHEPSMQLPLQLVRVPAGLRLVFRLAGFRRTVRPQQYLTREQSRCVAVRIRIIRIAVYRDNGKTLTPDTFRSGPWENDKPQATALV